MAQPAAHEATYADIEALPPHVNGQLIDGVLYTQARPASPHARASSILGTDLGGPFDRGRGGPGGWIILDEPELHFGRNVLVPDLAGWRRERMPEMPRAPYFELSPEWVCEVLSPSTAGLDRVKKLEVYRREKVAHLWFVDPDVRTLEVLRLDGERFVVAATEPQPGRFGPRSRCSRRGYRRRSGVCDGAPAARVRLVSASRRARRGGSRGLPRRPAANR